MQSGASALAMKGVERGGSLARRMEGHEGRSTAPLRVAPVSERPGRVSGGLRGRSVREGSSGAGRGPVDPDADQCSGPGGELPPGQLIDRLRTLRESWRGQPEALEAMEGYLRVQSKSHRFHLLSMLDRLPLVARYEGEIRRSIERTSRFLGDRQRRREGNHASQAS